MRISINWIKDYVDLSGIDIDKLAYKFTMSTAEIEEVYKMGADVKNVVAGKILTCEPVENSKKLHKLTVDVGDETVQCVCGAPNAREGIIVPFAKLGGSVVGMDKIEHVKLAGVDSYGMCCSGKEIGFSDDHSGIMELPEEVTPGTDIKEILELDDTIIEIDNKSLTNRPDLLGHYGIAREIAAITGRKLSPMPFKPLDTYKNLSAIPVEIQSEHIRERIAQFDGKLYMELGGKLFDDHHASRVLPGFKPDSKLRMLAQLRSSIEIIIVVSSGAMPSPSLAPSEIPASRRFHSAASPP